MHQTATNLNWVLGDYVLESVIRAGGRSTVYTARKHGEGELRALKLIAIGADSSDRTIADAEHRGAELQQEFARHHGLVPFVEEIAETRSCLYVVMEYVPGEDLFDALARGPLPWQRSLDIAIELATFLEKTHRFEVPGRGTERIIHADLKPGNVRIRPDGHICVLDFGIAKAMAERRLETTQKWGTRQYMSPEWLQSGTIDEQVDYWSLGVLLYEMLAGYRPFRRFERHDNQLEDAIRRREPIELLPSHAADPSLRQVVARLLAPEIRQRYASAVDIRAALEACRRDIPTLPVIRSASVRADAGLTPLPIARREDVPTLPAPVAGEAAALPVMLDSPPTEPCRRDGDAGGAGAVGCGAGAGAGAFDLPTERVPFPSVVGAVVPMPGLQVPPPLPQAQAALHMPLTPTGSISLGRVEGVGLTNGSIDVVTAPVLPQMPAALAPASQPPRVLATGRHGQNSRSLAAVLLWIVFATILASEGIACIAAERLRVDAATADEGDVDGIMKRRMQLAGWTLFDAALHVRTDPVLRDRLLSLADLVIANYRQEQPTVGRAEWEQAHGWLTRAVTLYPENKIVLARLRYTEGHLQRLTGQKLAEHERSGEAGAAELLRGRAEIPRGGGARSEDAGSVSRPDAHVCVWPRRRRQRGRLAEQRRKARLQIEPARARAARRRVSRARRARVADGARAGGRSEARRLRARAQGFQALRRILHADRRIRQRRRSVGEVRSARRRTGRRDHAVVEEAVRRRPVEVRGRRTAAVDRPRPDDSR